MGVWIVVLAALAGCGRGNFEVDADTDSPLGSASGANVMFVTSTMHTISELGADLAGADAICAMRASEAQLPGTYVALISTASMSARQRLGTSRGWLRTDGKPFGDRIDDILGSKIFYPGGIDEQGGMTSGEVITASNVDGSLNAANCSNLTDPGGMTFFGETSAGGFRWISSGMDLCANSYRIYCFGVGHTTPVAVTPAVGRKAFVTVQQFAIVTYGITAADQLCASEATAAGLTGTFKALLGTSGASASSRFDLTGPPWVRTDGVQLATTALGFMAGDLIAPLNITAVGGTTFGYVWTGGPFSAPAPNSSTCSDWQAASGSAEVGLAEFMGTNAFGNATGIDCGSTQRLYCLEQ